MPISRLLIANRGEIVVRIARTCRDLGIASVAVFSDADADAPHVRACDEAVRIGGARPAESYLRQEAILEAAARTGADAVHPGFGFLAENATFAQAVLDAGLTWVGPRPEVIAAMGDKLEAKSRMRAAGVPVLPSVDVAGMDDEAMLAAADDVGFPIMVKAAAGGGGTGMRAVEQRDDLLDAVAAARREAAGAFDDDRVFLERLVVRPRHVEVQILGDGNGTVLHLGERDCSIQRRHQKVVEEAPAPALDLDLVARLRDAAVAAGEAMGYTNAGTVEFIVDGRPGAEHPFAFLEVNTRLQVEHPVTELVTGLDLVRLQLEVAAGAPLSITQDDVVLDGHAIEVRLYAENPANDYLPATGTLTAFRPADGAGVRWDTGVEPGSVVSPFYDPMLAKVIAHGPTREVAAARLASTLRRTALLGVVTNRDLLLGVLGHEAFLAGEVSTAFLDEHFADPSKRFRVPTDGEAVNAAIVAALAVRPASVSPPHVPVGFSNTGLGPERQVVTVGGERLAVDLDWGREPRVAVGAEPEGAGDALEVEWQSLAVVEHADQALVVEVAGHRFRAEVAVDGDDVQVVLAAANVTVRLDPRFPTTALADEPGLTRAPMPGVVVTVAVAVGDRVEAGDLLAVVEAMKMEHRITADVDGTVEEVAVAVGDQLEADDLLAVVSPDEQAD